MTTRNRRLSLALPVPWRDLAVFRIVLILSGLPPDWQRRPRILLVSMKVSDRCRKCGDPGAIRLWFSQARAGNDSEPGPWPAMLGRIQRRFL